MIGKASEIKTLFIDGDFINEIQSQIEGYLRTHPNWEIIDIQYLMVQPVKSDFCYHTALIIYKEGEST